MPEIEKEFKNLLTKEQYEAIAGDYQSVFTKDVTQTNSYYDYEGLLQQHKMALRIRIVEGKETGEITLKIPQSSLEVLEYTEVLPVDILNAYNHDKQFTLPTSLQETLENKGITLQTVNQTALLTTHRLEGALSENEWLVLDESHYNGKVDYEMEMEVRSLELGEPVFLGILEKYKIERRQAESKIKRALSTRWVQTLLVVQIILTFQQTMLQWYYKVS